MNEARAQNYMTYRQLWSGNEHGRSRAESTRRRECSSSGRWSRRALRALAHPRVLAGCGHGPIITKTDFVAGTGGAHISLDTTA
jgi:hypothetical protein